MEEKWNILLHKNTILKRFKTRAHEREGEHATTTKRSIVVYIYIYMFGFGLREKSSEQREQQ